MLEGNPALIGRLKAFSPGDFAMSSVVWHELMFGAFKSQRVEANLARLEAIAFSVLDFDRDDARFAGEIRAQLAALGTPIGAYDVLIAGQARARDLVLITNNRREFERVAGLRVGGGTALKRFGWVRRLGLRHGMSSANVLFVIVGCYLGVVFFEA